MNKTEVSETSSDAGGSSLGELSRTTCPLEPPIPELASETNDFPELDLHPSGKGPVGTLRLYLSQRMFGFGTLKLAFGGITLFSRIKHAFNNDAKNAVLSK
jgi:hypothetical protein